MRRAKRLTALLLSAVMLLSALLGLTSCDRSYDEAEVVAAAKELLPRARQLYSIYYGDGIRYISTAYSDGDYYQADEAHLRQLGFSTVEELKNKTYATFSIRYSEDIFGFFLTSESDDEIVYRYARYAMNGTGEYMLVYRKHEPIFEDRMTYDLDTVKAVDSRRKFVNMTVEAVVESESGEEQRVELNFTLYEEAAGWRIASPCFGNYNKNK